MNIIKAFLTNRLPSSDLRKTETITLADILDDLDDESEVGYRSDLNIDKAFIEKDKASDVDYF